MVRFFDRLPAESFCIIRHLEKVTAMKRFAKIFMATAAMFLCIGAFAQRVDKYDSEIVFNPHWFLQAQAGVSYTSGKADFGKLISPAAAVYGGYQFTPVMGLRFGVSGWQSKGAWTEEDLIYGYNFLQGNVEMLVDLSNWWGGYRWNRFCDTYFTLGGGVNGGLGNSSYNEDDVSRIAGIARAGLGANLRVSDRVAIAIELNENLIASRYNYSYPYTIGWQTNLLVGVRVQLGKTHKTVTKPTPAPAPQPAPAPAPKPEPKPAPAPEPQPEPEPAPLPVPATSTENVFFRLNSAVIDASETTKISSLVTFLEQHPEASVTLTGYADVDTGTPAINLRISKSRAEAMAELLVSKGVSRDRITVDYKGDTVQPFEDGPKNRVCICAASE